jgi:GDP-L-fucose synthase
MGFYTDKRVAVLGGAGMIGSQLVELLKEAGAAKVWIFDDLSRGRRENLTRPFTLRQIDCADLGAIGTWLNQARPEIVFNLAAKVTGMHYNKDHHANMFLQNIALMTIPLRVAVEVGVEYFLQASTVCVYPRDMDFPVFEEEGHRGEPEPTNAGYGWAKRMGEKYAQWVCQEYGMKVGITRFSNCFGPRDYFDDETSHVIPALIKRFLGHEPYVKVYGSGDQIREFLYSRDAAIGAMKVMEYSHDATPVNIGNPGNRISINDLAMEIGVLCDSIKSTVNVTNVYPEGYPKRGSDITRLETLTGWVPETALNVGLAEAIKWYRENREIA